MKTSNLDCKLREKMLLSRRVEGDRLMLDDDVLKAALDGLPLSASQRTALAESPLTLRRLRQLSIRRVVAAKAWCGSTGMLRAASSGPAVEQLATDDNHWTFHFLPQGAGWQVILKLSAEAPFAAQLMREQPMLRVTDGDGAIVLQGRLDADGECENAWPFDIPPGQHFQQFGARFAVEPVRT